MTFTIFLLFINYDSDWSGLVNENVASEEGSHPTRHGKTLIFFQVKMVY